MQNSSLYVAQPFLDYLQFEKRYSGHTLMAYQTDIEQFFSYLQYQFQTSEVSLITHHYIRSWLSELKQNGITSKSINRKLSALKSFFKYQQRMGNLSSSPMTLVVAPKVRKQLPTFVQEADMKNMFTYLPFPDSWKGATDKLILQVFYETGIRASELALLKEHQLDVSNKLIKVLGKGNKERVIPINAGLSNGLQTYCTDKKKLLEQADSNYLFVLKTGKKLYSKYVYRCVHNYLSQVTSLTKKSPHVLRHTFATHLTNQGAQINAIKELLGHSSLAATQIYTHNNIEKLKDSYKKAHPKA